MPVALLDKTVRPEVPEVARKFRMFTPWVDQKGVYHAKSLVSKAAKDLTRWSGTSKEMGYEEAIEEIHDDMQEMIASKLIQRSPIWNELKYLEGTTLLKRYLEFCLPTLEVRKFQARQEWETEHYCSKEEFDKMFAYFEFVQEAVRWHLKRSGGSFVYTASGDVWLGK